MLDTVVVEQIEVCHCVTLHVWLFLQGQLLKVVDKMINHDFGEWRVKVKLSDGRSSTTAVIGNRLLEPHIGFSAIEYKRDFLPNKSDPAVKKMVTMVSGWGYMLYCKDTPKSAFLVLYIQTLFYYTLHCACTYTHAQLTSFSLSLL